MADNRDDEAPDDGAFRIAVVTLATGGRDIEAALEAGTRLSSYLHRQHPEWPPLYQSGIIYQRETRGHGGHNEERFLLRPLMDRLGWGDCDDLAMDRAGELRASGEDAPRCGHCGGPVWIVGGARCQAVESSPGAGRWHITVVRSDGTTEDPSAVLGMYDGLPRPVFPRVQGRSRPYNRR